MTLIEVFRWLFGIRPRYDGRNLRKVLYEKILAERGTR
jgi:hypothetical protein